MVQLNHVTTELHLPVSLEQRDSTPVGDQGMHICLSCESEILLEKFAPNPVWDQTQLYHPPLEQLAVVPHPHFEDNDDVFLCPNMFFGNVPEFRHRTSLRHVCQLASPSGTTLFFRQYQGYSCGGIQRLQLPLRFGRRAVHAPTLLTAGSGG